MEMAKTRCNIELGNDRFVQASEWKRRNPHRRQRIGGQGRKTDTHEKGDQSPPTQMEDARSQSRVFGSGPGRKERIRYKPRRKRLLYRESRRHLRGP